MNNYLVDEVEALKVIAGAFVGHAHVLHGVAARINHTLFAVSSKIPPKRQQKSLAGL